MRKNLSSIRFNLGIRESQLQLQQQQSQQQQVTNRLDLQKIVYINSQNFKKDHATIFHSPFKNGKRNNEYANPTFMSSDVFYSKDLSAYNNENNKPKVALQFNRNDLRKKELSEERIMKKSNSQIKVGKKENVSVNSYLKESFVRKVQQNEGLINELNILKSQKSISNIKYQEKRSVSKSKNDEPVYFQKNYGEKVRTKDQRKKQLIDHLKQTLKKKDQEKQNKKLQKRNQKKIMDEQSNRFYANVVSSLEFQRQRARLLSQLLNEQMNQRK